MKSALKPKGWFRIQQIRQGKVIKDIQFPNAIVDEGANALLDIMFDAATQITAWFLGLVDNAGFTAFNDADTHDTHAGWSENQDYTEGTRPAWTPDPAAARSITNSTTVDFTINNTAAIQGIFVSDVSVKGSVAAATLWATAAFSAVLNVINGDVLKVTYTVND